MTYRIALCLGLSLGLAWCWGYRSGIATICCASLFSSEFGGFVFGESFLQVRHLLNLGFLVPIRRATTGLGVTSCSLSVSLGLVVGG